MSLTIKKNDKTVRGFVWLWSERPPGAGRISNPSDWYMYLIEIHLIAFWFFINVRYYYEPKTPIPFFTIYDFPILSLICTTDLEM